MKLTVKELYVDGRKLPTPKVGDGLVITENKLWSANTGRLENTGEMAGTITAIKLKVDIKWPDLTMEEAAQIQTAVSSMTPFHALRFTDMSGAVRNIAVYFGDVSFGINAYSEGVQRITGVSVSAIEK